MTGNNIARLASAVAGMSVEDVATSSEAWRNGADSLKAVAFALTKAAPQIRTGFGADSQAGEAAEKVLTAMRVEVVEPRMADMQRASAALEDVRGAMVKAQAAQDDMPTSAPGAPPTYTGTAGETHEDITALKIYAAKMRMHNQQVAAYGDADEQARQQVEQVNTTYREAAQVMAEIHGEPITTEPPRDDTGGTGGSGGSGGGGGTRGPAVGPGNGTTGVVRPPSTTPTPTPTPTPNPTPVPDPTTLGPTPTPTPDPGPGLSPVPAGPSGPSDAAGAGPGAPSSSGSVPISGGGSSAAALGAAGAGALGAAGAKNLIGRLGSAAIGRAGAAPAVGAGGRSAAGGVLGRGSGGAATGATQPGRGAAAGRGGLSSGAGSAQRGAGGRGGTGSRGAAAGAGGRGAGGRGAGVAGAGGRGRSTKDDAEAREHDYDVEEDWLDDEGSPSVLG